MRSRRRSRGGADLIDVKEPAKGPLGAGRGGSRRGRDCRGQRPEPVSAALGEWSPNAITEAHWHLELKLNYVKWGLAGYSPRPGWGEDLLDTRRELPVGMEMVAVAYADWERAKSVPPAELVRFAKRFRFKAFLLDTWGKDGKTLLDFTTAAEVAELVESLKRVEIAVAIGGSLRPEHVKQLKGVAPDYFAVRILRLRRRQARRRHRRRSRQEVEGCDRVEHAQYHSDENKGAKGAKGASGPTGTLAHILAPLTGSE